MQGPLNTWYSHSHEQIHNIKPQWGNNQDHSQHQKLTVKYTGKTTMAVNQKINLEFKKPVLSKQVTNSSVLYSLINSLVLLKVTTTGIT